MGICILAYVEYEHHTIQHQRFFGLSVGYCEHTQLKNHTFRNKYTIKFSKHKFSTNVNT